MNEIEQVLKRMAADRRVAGFDASARDYALLLAGQVVALEAALRAALNAKWCCDCPEPEKAALAALKGEG